MSLVICVPLPGKQISLVILAPPPGKHISLVISVPSLKKHISRVICVPPPGKHIFLVICVPQPGKQRSLVICVASPGKHMSIVICGPPPCLSSELLILWEYFSPRDCKSSFCVSHSWSNHFFCDLLLILLPLAFHPASLHASTKVSLSNSDAVSMLDLTVYINSDLSSPTSPARKHMPATFCYSPAT